MSGNQGFLTSSLADALSLALFAACGGGALGVALGGAFGLPGVPLQLPPLPAAAVALGLALLGPLGLGIERGRDRPVGIVEGALLALPAGFSLLLAAAAGGVAGSGLSWAAGCAVVYLLLAGPLSAWAGRLDRGESGWRGQLRATQPADGVPDAARRIAAVRLPRALERVVLPFSLLARVGPLLLILLYQLTLSRLMPPSCMFEPSCSRYGYTAFARHGVLKGLLLTGLRLVRCSPLTNGGHDPVPAEKKT